jgi:hypothetical protein
MDFLQTINGCDSIIRYSITINSSSTSTSTVTACDSHTWNGTTYTLSGVYTFVTTNTDQCDSVHTLNLTINQSNVSSTDVTECDSYDWNGQTYTASGVYTFETVNANGCDSTVTLDLTIGICGCMDSTAINYDSTATIDDGSCCALPTNLTQLFIDSNTTELSWNSSSTSFKLKYREDGISTWQGQGVNIVHNTTSPYQATILPAVTYNWRVRDNNIGCPDWVNGTTFTTPTTGCMDSAAINYNSFATYDNGTCIATVYGCTDSTSFNYNVLANMDDGSCICIGVTYFYSIPSTVSNCDGFAVANAVSFYQPITYNWVNSNGVLISNSNNATILCNDAFIITITDNVGCSISDTLILGTILGCTDSTMQNYNQYANIDNGGCVPFFYGCIDSTMYNYNSLANTDDGSCILFIYGCTDSTMYNYDSLANTSNTSCVPIVYGCIDSTMYNYNFLSNTDDGSCISCNPINLSVSFIDSSSTELTWFSAEMGCKLKYKPSGNPGSNNWTNGNPNITIISNTFSPTIITTSPGETYDWRIKNNVCNSDWIDGHSFTTPTIGCIDSSAFNYNALATFDDGNCIPFIYGCLDNTMYNYDSLANTSNGNCITYIYGCTDSMAYNYDTTANTDNGSCQYCNLSVSLFVSQNSSSSSCDGWAFVNYATSNSPVTYLWSNGNISNSVFNLCPGYYNVTITDSVGCTNSESFIIGICNTPISGLFISNIIDDRVTANFDNMNTYDTTGNQECRVDQLRIKYREVGTSSWSQTNMGLPTGYDPITGICNGTQKTDKTIYNLSPGTTYEWQMRVWYCSTGATSWVVGPNFTTLGDCPNVGNLNVYGANPTKATFYWDDSNGGYEFVRIKMRVDSISNPQGSDWFNVGGAGISYPTFTKNKSGLVPGETYRGQARTWCDPNGGAYRSATWSPLVFWTQPTTIRLEGGSAINKLAVYPNPSRDIFNVSFTSDTKQNLKVRILNVIGEELINENLEQFIGEYTKQINLTNNAKGIYFLEIETNDGIINKKLILQ